MQSFDVYFNQIQRTNVYLQYLNTNTIFIFKSIFLFLFFEKNPISVHDFQIIWQLLLKIFW
jgi:hypothetical protein